MLEIFMLCNRCIGLLCLVLRCVNDGEVLSVQPKMLRLYVWQRSMII